MCSSVAHNGGKGEYRRLRRRVREDLGAGIFLDTDRPGRVHASLTRYSRDPDRSVDRGCSAVGPVHLAYVPLLCRGEYPQRIPTVGQLTRAPVYGGTGPMTRYRSGNVAKLPGRIGGNTSAGPDHAIAASLRIAIHTIAAYPSKRNWFLIKKTSASAFDHYKRPAVYLLGHDQPAIVCVFPDR